MEYYDNSDEFIEEDIHLKLNSYQQYYVYIYEQDINDEIKEIYENKS
jgi:hypothetical protein